MTRAFTAAQITRACRGARKDNPNAVVEFVMPSGQIIRILPSDPAPASPPKQNPFDLLDLQ